jgi:hypothetical protein
VRALIRRNTVGIDIVSIERELRDQQQESGRNQHNANHVTKSPLHRGVDRFRVLPSHAPSVGNHGRTSKFKVKANARILKSA